MADPISSKLNDLELWLSDKQLGTLFDSVAAEAVANWTPNSSTRTKLTPETAKNARIMSNIPSGTNIIDAVLSDGVLGMFLPTMPVKALYINKKLEAGDQPHTVAHENVHRIVAGQFPRVDLPDQEGAGDSKGINWKFDELVGNRRARYQIADALTSPEVIKHFVKTYGVEPRKGYINEETKNLPNAKTEIGTKGQAGNMFHEIAAELSTIQQVSGKFLVDDPFLREKVFNTPEKRAAIDAVISRITRTDKNDPAPFTANYAGSGATDPKERNFFSGFLEKVRDDFFSKYEVKEIDMEQKPEPPKKKFKRGESF